MHFDFEDENPMSPPKLRVEPGQRVVREACDLSLPVQAGEVTRGSVISLYSGHCEWSRPLSAGMALSGKTRLLTSTSDFYPRFVIKNMFKDLIICIFPSELTR